MKTALTIIFIVISVIITILVLCQESKDNGLGSLTGGSNQAETYWSKNKGRDKEGYLQLATWLLLVVFMVIAVLISSKFLA